MRELLSLAAKYVEGVAYNDEKIKDFIQKKHLFQFSWVPLEVIDGVYFNLVHAKELIPIEQLAKEEKQRLWNLIGKWVEGTNEHKMRCTRVLHFIEFMQNKKVQSESE
jgi:hypothetical protein